jgi:hypothetical protein
MCKKTVVAEFKTLYYKDLCPYLKDNTTLHKPAQFLSLLHLSYLPTLSNGLPPLEPSFTRRTSGHFLGTLIAVNLALLLLC